MSIAKHYSQCHAPDAEEAILLYGFDVLINHKPAPPELGVVDQVEWTKTIIKVYGQLEGAYIRAFINNAGRPGVGPIAMEAGDPIVIFAGDHTPFTVREETTGDEKFYRLLGSVYVYGLMDGEAMEGDVQFEDIALI